MTCNRSTSADTWNALGDCADLNGDAGQQWVALYACRNNEVMQPILADSLKAVRESSIRHLGSDRRDERHREGLLRHGLAG